MAKITQDQAHFLLLKVNSLMGLVPIGVFLAFHLGINALRTVGPLQYQLSIDLINNLPFLLGIEVVFIYAPLLLHSMVGFYIYFSGKRNVRHYGYARNWLYTLQRISGVIVFAFLIYHMGTTVAPKLFYGKDLFLAAPFLIDVLNAEFQTWTGRIIYLIGITSATFHFANGLWGFCISWGIIIGQTAQRNASIVFAMVGLALTGLGFATVLEFSLHPVSVTPTVGG